MELEVSLAPPLPEDFERAAQLSQRTNQFNTSGVRRNATELSSLLSTGERGALLVHVRDRFGDYGQVGFASFYTAGAALNVDSFLMSCRVLGKGVEHRVLAALGREAKSRGLERIVISFKSTARNQPAEDFLKLVGSVVGEDGLFHLSADHAANVVFDPASSRSRETTAKSRNSVAYLVQTGFPCHSSRARHCRQDSR